MNTNKMIKGSVILNREMTTQLGKLKARKGTQLMSVFLGSIKEGEEPCPEERMESMGWRQMAMFECAVLVCIDHEDRETEEFSWRLAFSCLGAIDAVEASVRFADKMIKDEFNRSPPGTPAPYLASLTVGTIKLGPISEDGTPFNGRGPAFFGWKHDRGVSLFDHLEELRIAAQKHST